MTGIGSRTGLALALLIGVASASTSAALAHAAAPPAIVSFPSGNLTLKGYLYRPAGPGPFPLMIWNHGSEHMKDPGNPRPAERRELGEWYAAQGFVLFMPHRRGHGLSPGEWIMDGIERESTPSTRSRRMVELQDDVNADVVAAVAYARTLSFVDTTRMYMSGVSFGGIQTLLAAEKPLGLRAAVPFAPGAMSWARSPELRARLASAVRHRTVPVFLIQAANDFDLAPSDELGPLLKGSPLAWQAKVFPAYGTTPQEGHGKFAVLGEAVWGPDVLAFLARCGYRSTTKRRIASPASPESRAR